ncbi:hypothetical protein OIDMADRAFT_118157 [Oidiodendron maius Zn]|uniref:Haloacid dehalogenase-like hydrolase n=1 Tax=Oidiodendron maius (strain Zn) TaxID=913774 RepID=A0A0C3HM63_OIDMZ|nr:hypothetical protein OIDMADRAFT_118157 [Oidiodendron maius Zn]
MNKYPIPEVFILDFDGTITKNDTIDTIFKSVLPIQDEMGRNMSRAWQEIIVKYKQDYHSHVQMYEPKEDERVTPTDEIKFYRSFRAMEQTSFSRISNSHIFAGIDEEQWEELGSQAVKNEEVVVRNGFESFLNNVRKAKSKWAIVSVNFSCAFIRGVLGSYAGPGSNVPVMANQPNKDGIMKGPLGITMTTSDAKLDAALSLVGTRDDRPKGSVVYIGDSGTDIECLLADGIAGVIISGDGQSSILRMMRRIGYKTWHIEAYKYNEPKTVYWARDFLEIVQSPLLS